MSHCKVFAKFTCKFPNKLARTICGDLLIRRRCTLSRPKSIRHKVRSDWRMVWRYCEFQLIHLLNAIPCAVFDLNSSISYRTAKCIIRIGAIASNTFKAFKLKHSSWSIQVEIFEVESFVCECSVQIKQRGTPALESKAAFRSVQRCLKVFEHQATCERLECEHFSRVRESMANEHGHWNMANEYGKWVWKSEYGDANHCRSFNQAMGDGPRCLAFNLSDQTWWGSKIWTINDLNHSNRIVEIKCSESSGWSQMVRVRWLKLLKWLEWNDWN